MRPAASRGARRRAAARAARCRRRRAASAARPPPGRAPARTARPRWAAGLQHGVGAAVRQGRPGRVLGCLARGKAECSVRWTCAGHQLVDTGGGILCHTAFSALVAGADGPAALIGWRARSVLASRGPREPDGARGAAPGRRPHAARRRGGHGARDAGRAAGLDHGRVGLGRGRHRGGYAGRGRRRGLRRGAARRRREQRVRRGGRCCRATCGRACEGGRGRQSRSCTSVSWEAWCQGAAALRC